MKERLIGSMLAAAMIFGGFGLLWASAGWRVSVGVLLVLWGHNIETSYRQRRP